MAIATRCPHCDTAYTLKDELAGKRVTCKTCRKVFPVVATPAAVKVPAPAKPVMDAEQLALAALSEDLRPPEPEPELATITVKCEHCDFENVYEGRMAGKNAPCKNEECRKIIKVPALKKAEAKDWRNVAKRPSLAKVDAGKLEGAWGNVETQAVSREAIVQAEADRIDDLEPVSWSKRIVVLTSAAAVLLVVVAGVLFAIRQRGKGKQDQAMKMALEFVDPDPKNKTPKLKKEPAGLVHLLAGSYEFGRKKPKDAKDHLIAARSGINHGGDNSAERCAALVEVAVLLADLAGNKAEVDQGSRLDYERDKLNAEIRSTLSMLPRSPGEENRDLHAYAFRRLTRVLAKEDHIAGVVALAALVPDDERAEIYAVIGLELITMGHRAEAEKLAPKTSVGQSKGGPSLVALWLAIDTPAKAQAIAPVPGKDVVSPMSRVGYAEGWARLGRISDARALAWSDGRADDRLRAGAAVAAVVVDKQPSDTTDLEQCAKLLDTELKGRGASAWLLLRLMQLSLQADKLDLGSKFAAAISDSAVGLRSWGQYEVLQAHLKAMGKQSADWERVGEVGGPERLAHWMAWAALARHNVGASGASVMKTIKGWEDAQKPFGYAGVALAER